MDRALITLLVLASVSGVLCQNLPRCLFSRLDYVECEYRNKDLKRPGPNQFSSHHTRLRPSDSGFVRCNVRAKGQRIRAITDQGTDNMRILYSPGLFMEKSYDDQILMEFNIECAEDRLAFFNVTQLDIEEENCVDNTGKKRCQDYILIDRGDFGTTEICGNKTPNSSLLQLESRNFKVFFRSSEENRYPGFEMYVICFKEEERDLPGCFEPSDFDVCDNITSGDDSGSGAQLLGTRGRRHTTTYDDKLTYGDLFPGYSPGMKMRNDVAKFHNMWLRRKRQDTFARFQERNILFTETVNYTRNTIIIFGPEGQVVERYTNILILQTFNTTGDITTYIGSVESDISPHFIGPGPMIIVGRHAYFQLFVIDPRGIIPDPEEEEELIAMNRQLLDAVPESADFDFVEEDKTPADLGIFLGRKKRQLRDQVFTDDDVFVALRNLEACNPVLRAQAEANLQFYNMNDSARLQTLLNFTISCTLNVKRLQCKVISPTAILPDRTTCQVNEQEPTICDPFFDPLFMLTENTVDKVIIRAINCNGQRAKQCLNKDGKPLVDDDC